MSERGEEIYRKYITDGVFEREEWVAFRRFADMNIAADY